MPTITKGPSIRMDDFNTIVPNGTWIRQRDGAAPRNVILPIEGVLTRESVEGSTERHIHTDTRLTVTSSTSIDPVRLYAGEVEYQVTPDEWISWRELCLRASEWRIMEGLGLDVTQVGSALYAVASWIEGRGNKGYSNEDVMVGCPSFPIRLLGDDYRLFWENILFFAEGESRRDFNGWGVHKRTPAHWSITWLDRFGLNHPQADVLIDAAWDEALTEHEARAIKRIHESYMGVDLEHEQTRDVAYKAAAMWLMSRWAEHRAWDKWDTRALWALQARIYKAAYEVFQHELKYRQDQQPQKRKNKKLTQAARDDWASARGYFYPRIGFDAYRFYSQAYVNACCESSIAPDLTVDFDALPRDVIAEPEQE